MMNRRSIRLLGISLIFTLVAGIFCSCSSKNIKPTSSNSANNIQIQIGGDSNEDSSDVVSSREVVSSSSNVPVITPNDTKKILAKPAKYSYGPLSYPQELLTSYSPNSPSGILHFTGAQKKKQLEDAKRIFKEIKTAITSGKNSYTILPGEYRFTPTFQFHLKDVKRPDNNPFTIIGTGVTFWIELNGKPFPSPNYGIQLTNCDNIIIDGITIDSDPRGAIEGYVSELDKDNNRIKFELFDDTMPASYLETMGLGGLRFFKQNGNHISTYYDMDGTQAASSHFNKIEKIKENTYWISPNCKQIVESAFDVDWFNAYGADGTLQVGDLVSIPHSVILVLNMQYCKQIIGKNLNIYSAKSWISENAGYGNHLWINCNFMSRPGTNQLLGGEANLSGVLDKGQTYDNCVFGRSTDDQINMLGRWGFPKEIGENSIRFDVSPILKAGEHIILYDIKTGKAIKTLVIKEIGIGNIIFTEKITSLGLTLDNFFCRYPQHESEGWVIKNSFFLNGYQRILLQIGHGTFENNIIMNMGHQVVIGSNSMTRGSYGNEGGFLDDLVFKDNLIINTAITPKYSTVDLRYTPYGIPAYKNITFDNNLVINSGGYNFHLANTENLIFKNNIMANPFYAEFVNTANYGSTSVTFPSDIKQSVFLKKVKNAQLMNNTLFESIARTNINTISKSRIIGYSVTDKANISSTGEKYYFNADDLITKRVKELLNPQNKLYAKTIINIIRKEFVK